MKAIMKLLLSKHTRHQVFGSKLDFKSFWTCIQPENVISTNLVSNCDVARKTPKFGFLATIVKFKHNFRFMIETTVDSLLFGDMGRVYILKKYLKVLKNVKFQHF